MRLACQDSGVGEPPIVAAILGDDDPIIGASGGEDGGVREASQRRGLAHRHNIMAARSQPGSDRRVHHLVQEQLQARCNSRLRSHSASARSDSSSRTRIHSSISSWYSM